MGCRARQVDVSSAGPDGRMARSNADLVLTCRVNMTNPVSHDARWSLRSEERWQLASTPYKVTPTVWVWRDYF